MAYSKITRNFQISIPKEIRERFRLREGDLVEMEERDGEIILVPKKLVDADQAWFWSREWQEGEREAEEDIREGRVSRPLRGIAELKKHLGDA
jgi:AbrB family looped-hinge helix DNA binding protein